MGKRFKKKDDRQRTVLSLDASGGVMGEMTLCKAVRAIVSGRAILMDPKQWTRVEVLPASLAFVSVILFPHSKAHGKVKLMGKGRRQILMRDQYECQYCGKPASTIDHVKPRCQQGTSSFKNQVAACSKCNNAKAGRTPEQAGMPLLRPVPTPREVLEARLARACN